MRNRLSTADQAQLLALLGPNYPEPSTLFETIQAATRAAGLNPDASEVFQRLGNYLVLFGPQAGLDDWFPRGIAALDSATALDSDVGRLLRLYTALLKRDSSDIRRTASHYFRSNSSADLAEALRWVVAQSLDDKSVLSEMRPRLHRSVEHFGPLVAYSILLGFPLADIDDAITVRLREPRAAESPCRLYWALIVVAACVARWHGPRP